MVKKLFKHEFLAYARVMSVVYIILLTIATAGRVIQVFENDSIPYTIISTFSGIAYGGSAFAAIAFCSVFAIIRFYKNLFTNEGYLTFTLPVTSAQQIWVKMLTALSFELITGTVVLLSGCIFAAGELLTEIIKALVYLWDKLFAFAGFHAVAVALEVLVLFGVTVSASILLYYTFISIGQLSKKNRILAAVGAYFLYCIIVRTITTVSTIILAMLSPTTAFDKLYQWIEMHPYAAIHIGMCGGILLSGIFGLICFVIIKSIITKKLNLE